MPEHEGFTTLHAVKKLLLMAVSIGLMLWSLFSIYRFAVVVAVFLLCAMGPFWVHYHLVRRVLAADGVRLIHFHQCGGGAFCSYSYDWPWWVEYYPYEATIASESGAIFKVGVWIQGSCFGLIAPRINYCHCILPEINHEESVRWLQNLGQLKRLRHLDLGHSAITDTELVPIGEWGELETLMMNSTFVTDRGLVHLKQLHRLKELRLEDTATTQEGRDLLRVWLPNCEIWPQP